MPTLNIEQTLEALEELGDDRLAHLQWALTQRIRHGKHNGDLEELLGAKAARPGGNDAFRKFKLSERDENLQKAVHYVMRYEQMDANPACHRVAAMLKAFPAKYRAIESGAAWFEEPIDQYLYRACQIDPDAVGLKHGGLYKILF